MSVTSPGFKQLLEENYQWPAHYSFKFLLKTEHLEDFKSKFEMDFYTEKTSTGGKYTSITYTKLILTTDEVFETYKVARGHCSDLFVL